MKCAGLDAEAIARRSVEPSTMSLLGIVRHLAEGEQDTFRVMMAGQDSAPAVLLGRRPERRLRRCCLQTPRWLRRRGMRGERR